MEIENQEIPDYLKNVSDFTGYHNSNPGTEERLIKSKSYQDLSTICIVPCHTGIPPKIVQSWRNLMTPMNQKFLFLTIENMEVGEAYSKTIEMILNHQDLSKWKYVLTMEHDNSPPPDGLLKLYENIDKYDGIGGLYFTKGEAGQPMCYDDQTEILTRDGWKFFKDVTLNDIAATVDEFGELKYYPIIDKQVYEYEGDMLHWNTQRVDMLVTPDHSIYCRKRSKKLGHTEFKLIRADEGEKSSRIKFKRNAFWKGKEQEYFYISEDRKVRMDDWLEFLGFYISEGCCPNFIKYPNRGLVDIRQCKSDIYEKIYNVTNVLGFNSRKRDGRIQFTDVEIRKILGGLGKSADKYVPNYVKNLSPRQIKIFLTSLWLGDGTHKSGVWENYYTKSAKLANDVQELLLKIGKVGVIGKRNRKTDQIYIVSPSHSSFEPIMKKPPERKYYKGIVYDVTVPENHTLYIRRNGKPLWSGNCYGPTSETLNFRPFLPSPNGITPCYGIAMGFSLFKLSMFKDGRLPRPLFETKQAYTPGVGIQAYTQDLKFCEEAGKLGYKFAVDSRVKVGHYDYTGTAGKPDFFW